MKLNLDNNVNESHRSKVSLHFRTKYWKNSGKRARKLNCNHSYVYAQCSSCGPTTTDRIVVIIESIAHEYMASLALNAFAFICMSGCPWTIPMDGVNWWLPPLRISIIDLKNFLWFSSLVLRFTFVRRASSIELVSTVNL